MAVEMKKLEILIYLLSFYFENLIYLLRDAT